MTIQAIIFFWAGLCAFCCAQPFEVKPTGTFSRIEFYGDVQAELVKNGTESYQIKRLNELTEKDVKVTLEGSVLKVRTKIDLNNKRRAYLVINYTQIVSIAVHNGAEVYSDSALTGEVINLTANSGSSAYVNLNCRSVSADLSSGGRLVLKGTVKAVKVSAVAGSTFDGNALIADEADMMSSIESKIYVIATKSLTANATLQGEIYYGGNPDKREIKITLGGIVTPLKNE